MRRGLLAAHRALGLAALAFWLVQGASGTILAFRWEIEDALLPGTAAPAEARALGARIAAISGAGGLVSDLWASSAASTRFDIYYSDAQGDARVARVDGAGRILRDAGDAGIFANGAIFDTLTLLHAQLLAGEAGSWVVASSGILLLTNLILGLRLAWPRSGRWRLALKPRIAGPPPVRAHAWHRALGLWLGVPILPFVAAGVLLCFDDGLRRALDAEVPTPRTTGPPGPPIAPATALAIAAARHPGSKLSTLVLPAPHAPWYLVRQRRPGDLARNWGTSTLFVSMTDGHILDDHPSSSAAAGRRLFETVYPLHTGQFAGIAGRLLVLVQGIWLTAMVTLGLRLWRARTPK